MKYVYAIIFLVMLNCAALGTLSAMGDTDLKSIVSHEHFGTAFLAFAVISAFFADSVQKSKAKRAKRS